MRRQCFEPGPGCWRLSGSPSTRLSSRRRRSGSAATSPRSWISGPSVLGVAGRCSSGPHAAPPCRRRVDGAQLDGCHVRALLPEEIHDDGRSARLAELLAAGLAPEPAVDGKRARSRCIPSGSGCRRGRPPGPGDGARRRVAHDRAAAARCLQLRRPGRVGAARGGDARVGIQRARVPHDRLTTLRTTIRFPVAVADAPSVLAADTRNVRPPRAGHGGHGSRVRPLRGRGRA